MELIFQLERRVSNSAPSPSSPLAETQPQLSRFELYKQRKAAEAAAAATAAGRDAAAGKGEAAAEARAAARNETRGRSLSRKRVAVRRRRPQKQ